MVPTVTYEHILTAALSCILQLLLNVKSLVV